MDVWDLRRAIGRRHAELSVVARRLARWSAGALIDRPVVHDFHEEVFIVEGELVVGCDAEGEGGEAFGPYTFACRPPGAVHGPFVSRTGCVMFEIQYYE